MVKINMDIEGSYSQIDENITDINKKLSLLENEALSDLDRLELQEECLNLLTGNKKIFDFLVSKMKSQMTNITNLILTDKNEEIQIEIRELLNSVNYLIEKSKFILGKLDDERINFKNEAVKSYPSQIELELKSLKDKIKGLIQRQIDRYNERVRNVNGKIYLLKKSNINEIMEIEPLAICTVSVNDYRQVSHLKQLDYKRLEEVSTLVEKLSTERVKTVTDPLERELIDDLEYLTTRISEFSKNINNLEDKNMVHAQFIVFKSVWLMPFLAKISKNKDKISSDLYMVLMSQMKVFESSLKIINSRLFDDKVFIYSELREKVLMLYSEINMFVTTMNGICVGGISDDLVNTFNKEISNYQEMIRHLHKFIKEFPFKEKNQSFGLENKLRELEKVINEAKNNLNDSRNSVKDSHNNGKKVIEIDDVESELKELDELINNCNGIIKSKSLREKIQNKIDKVDKDIQKLRLNCQNDKKYFNKIYALGRTLDKLNIDYRERCPLGIKQIKTAKDVYKKNDKLVLISSGLAISVLSFTGVGHVLIPAIVLGNIVLAPKYPILNNINEILGKVIKAQKREDGTWVLANGIEISATSAVTSLLKSLANCENPAIVGKTVSKIRELAKKIALKERFNKLKNTFQNSVDDLKLNKLYNLFLDSMQDIDVFCMKKGLSESEKRKFLAYINYREISSREKKNHGR